ncbi:MAG: response regulator [Anaerolineae bacterium]|nr:response regulator [Anaerolineae bacterium]
MGNTILVIDDDLMIRQMVALHLEREGYTVLQAEDGPSGIETYCAENPDLVVVDIAMPMMNGFEVTNRIRAIQQDNKLPRTPIIVLTSYARSFAASPADQRGIDSYLTKPITRDQLLTHVNRFLAERRV